MEKISKPLPEFFVIGAAKSGTTALHQLLKQHPEIFMPAVKETDFFVREHHRGMDWYSDTFYRGANHYKLAGDASPTYLDQSNIVAPRILQSYPHKNIKFIAIFRDPVERAYSAYWYNQQKKQEERTFEELVELSLKEGLQQRAHSKEAGFYSLPLISGSQYATNLQPFLDAFPVQNFFYLLQDDLLSDPQTAMSNLFSFLGVNASVEITPGAWNAASLPRWRKLNKFVLSPFGPIHKLLRPFTHQLPVHLRRRLKRYILRKNRTSFSYPPINEETEKALRELLREEMRRLERIINRDLSKWYE